MTIFDTAVFSVSDSFYPLAFTGMVMVTLFHLSVIEYKILEYKIFSVEYKIFSV